MEKIKLMHQCGHNMVWNLSSYGVDSIGDGFILSPVNMKSSDMVKLHSEIKQLSILDPQFYIPNSEHKNLNTYSYFPNCINDVYSTADFEENAYKTAKACLKFQCENFPSIVIPTLFFNDVPANYIDKIDSLITTPFINCITESDLNRDRKIYLSIIIKDINLTDDYFDDLLDYVTKYHIVNGVYLIPYNKRTLKRIKDIDFLYKLMLFIDTLKENEMEVHIGYTDIEGYLLSLTGVDSLPLGTYENLRNFAENRFIKREKKQQSPPTPRVYSSKLLQWVDHRYLASLYSEYEGAEELFDKTKYRIEMFEPGFNWNFQKSELYKHYFVSYGNQIMNMPDDFDLRYEHISNTIKNAIICYKNIEDSGIIFDNNSDGSHLPAWGTALNRFYKYKRGD